MKKKLQSYLISNILAMMGISCYVLADTFFISAAAGANGITALNLTLPIYGLMFALGSMIATGSATKHSLEKMLPGSNSHRWFSSSLLWTGGISLIFVVMGLTVPEEILRFMGGDDTIVAIGIPYLRTAMLCAPFFMTNYTFTAFVRNDDSPRISMIAILASSFLNILFDYVLMFPLKMGMLGAALASGLSPLVSILICLVHFCSRKNTIRFRLQQPRLSRLISSCKLGIAAFVGEISGGITCLCFNVILLRLSGNAAVAAYGIVANVSLVGIAVFNGIAQGLQPMASEAEGTQNEQAKRYILRYCMVLALVLSAILITALYSFARPIVNIFNSEGSAEMENLAVPGLRLYCFGFLFSGINVVLSGFYGAIGNARKCFLISISRGVVAIVIFAFLLSGLFGITGVWLAFPAAELFTCFLPFLSKKRI